MPDDDVLVLGNDEQLPGADEDVLSFYIHQRFPLYQEGKGVGREIIRRCLLGLGVALYVER